MRPITLEIEGLQSFKEKRTIDFETLGETGLFGIFGPTGSGKSTILDAITFALFGDVRRAKNGTQGIINIHCRTMRVSFTFELARDGARKRYRVERVSQKKKDPDNATVVKIARLLELTEAGEIPICDKATDVTNKVTELIGLSRQDFTRAVVLPQNSFQEFLLMNHADRRRMLERIFYLEEYGRELSDKLNRKMEKVKSCFDTLTGELKAYQDASDDALKEAREAMEKAAAEKEKALRTFKELEQRYQEANEVWQLVREMADVEEQGKQHATKAQEIADRKTRLARAEKAAMLAEPIRNNRELAGRLQETSGRLAAVEARLPAVQADLMKYQKNYDALKHERTTEEPRLVARKARLEDALVLRDEIASADTKLKSLEASLGQLKTAMTQKELSLRNETDEYNRLQAEAARLKKEWEALIVDPEYRKRVQEGASLEDEGDRLKKSLTDLRNEAEHLKKTIGEAEARLEQTRKAIAGVLKDAEKLAEENDRLDGLIKAGSKEVQKEAQSLQDIRGICRVMQLRRDRMEELKSQLAQINGSLEKAEQRSQMLLKARDQAAAACGQCKLELEQTERLLDRGAACRLARQLKEGEACPVCGSTHHPRPADSSDMEELSELEARAEELRSRLEAAETALKQAEAELLVNAEQLKAAKEQQNQTREALEEQTRECELERQKLPENFRNLDFEHLASELKGLEEELSRKQEALADREKAKSDLSQRLQKQSEALSAQRALESGILSELRLNRERLDKTMLSLEETQKLWQANCGKVSELLAAWSISSIRGELERLVQNDQRSDALRRKLEETNQQMAQKESRLARLKEELQAVRTDAVRYEAERAHLENEMKTKTIRIRQLAGEANLEDEIQRIRDRLEAYETKERALTDTIKSLEADYHSLQNDYSLLLSQKKTLAGDLEQDEKRLRKALADMGFENTEEVEKALLSDEVVNDWKAGIEEYERTAIRIQTEKDRIARKLNARTLTEEGWREISQAWQEALAARDTLSSEYEIAAHHYQSIKEKHEKWCELTRQLEETSRKMSLLEQIRKLLIGDKGKDNSFIDYIAEERLRYVAAKASETLGAMTRYKYALELDADNGFVIRDNANGGVYRMVTTLSGGETFLTSLSLALALSEQIQLKGQSPLEFFFLDEGFGTLDRNLLDNVIDSLERISRKERVIGLISHVPELRGRIGRRLIVEPPTPDGEGTRVRIEKG